MDVFTLFWIFLKASLFSTAGTGNLPLLHADLTARHWATDGEFVEALTIGQVSPGPTGLWAISLGYLVYGLPGALLSTVAIALPPVLVLFVDMLYRRVHHLRAVQGFMRGLSLAVVAIFGVVLVQLVARAGVQVETGAILVAAFGLAASRRVPIPAIIALAALAGMITR